MNMTEIAQSAPRRYPALWSESGNFEDPWLWASGGLARRSGGVGKWLLFPLFSEADGWWAKVCQAIARGELGDQAKIKTLWQCQRDREQYRTVICVYCGTEELEAKRVGYKLVDMGFKRKSTDLRFKPDSATHAGQYGQDTAIYRVTSRGWLKC